ncbi:MAG: SpaA isopeptide-forming pilin-related protein [Firmicutes bacterium]|nr:SpaA isopeptide-forming pilin-related protein [Bacillota bacterium]
MAAIKALPKRKKRRIRLLAVVLLLMLVAVIRLPALHDTFGLSDTKIDLRLDGPVEPLSPFTLHISQGVGGEARTTLTLAPGLMFADSLPANMTEVHYDDAAQTLSFAWASGAPRQAAIQLFTAATASRTISAVSGNLSGSVIITPAGSNLPAPAAPSAAPAEVAAAPAEVAAGSSVNPAPATVPGDTYGPAGSGPAGNNPAGAAASAAPAELVAALTGAAPAPNTVSRDTYGAQIQTQVYPLSQSVAPGDELYFVAVMNTTGMNSSYTNASWDIILNYDPTYVSYVGATSFPDLTGPTVNGDPGSITVAYKFPADDAYAGGIYMSVLDLTTADTTPEGALVRSTSAFDSDQYISTDDAAQVITDAANQPGFMGIMPLADSLYTSNLANILTGVTITDLYDQPVSEYVTGENYKFSLSFKENIAYQLQYDNNGVLYYQLPPEITVLDPVLNEDILVGTQKIGTYSVDTNGYVTVKFDDIMEDPAHPGAWIDTSGTNTNFIDNYINAFFNLGINAQFNQPGDNVTIDFGNNYFWEFPIHEHPLDAVPAIAKTGAVDPNDPWLINYTATISAADGSGTIYNPTFYDNAGGYFNLTDLSFVENVRVSTDGGATWSNYTQADAPAAGGTGTPGTYYWVTADPEGGFHLVFPNDATLTPGGDPLEIKYDIDFRKLWLARNADPYHMFWGDVITNSAYAAGANSNGDQLPPVMARSTVYVQRRMYTFKTGSLSSDGGAITWTATAGDGVDPLTGKTIYDDLYDYTHVIRQSFNGPITIKLYAADHTTQIGSDITLPAPAGASFAYNVPTTNPEVYWADITYNTTTSDPYAQGYSNTIGVTVGGKDYGFAQYIGNPAMTVGLKKTAVVTVAPPDDHGNSYRAIQSTITWTIPPAYYGRTIYLTDGFNFGANGYSNVPYDLNVSAVAPDPANPGGTETIRIPVSMPTGGSTNGPTGSSPYGLVAYVGGDAIPNAANQTAIWFMWSPDGSVPADFLSGNYYYTVTDGTDSLSPFVNGATITITYLTMIEGPNASKLTGPGNGNTYGQPGDPLSVVVDNQDLIGYPVYAGNQAQSVPGPYDFDGVNPTIAKKAAPGGNGKYIDYTVALDQPNPHGDAYDMGSDPIFTDTFDSDLLQYVTNSFVVKATDSSWYPHFYGLYDAGGADDLSQYINVNYEADGVTPTGTSTLTVHLSDLKELAGNGLGPYMTMPWFGPPATVSAPVIPEWWQVANRLQGQNYPIYVYYRLQLKPDAAPGLHSVDNTAAINTVWTAKNTSTIGAEVASKEMALITSVGNKMAVTVNVNQLGQALEPDSPNGTYVIEDQMNDTLAAYLSSIKIEAETSPGSGDWVEQVIDPTWGNPWSFITAADNKLLFTVPDQTSLRITYQALVKGTVGETVYAENSINILGNYFAEAHASFLLQKSGATAGGTLMPITLYKQDADQPGVYLPGAVFELYMNQYYTDMPTVTPSGRPNTQANPPETIDGVGFYYAGTWTTGPSGQVLMQTQYLTADNGAIYALKETVAPAGYRLPANPFTCFTLGTALVPDGFTPALQDITDYINVANQYIGGPMLPVTGGNGMGRYMMIGILLLAAGFLAARFSTRRKQNLLGSKQVSL